MIEQKLEMIEQMPQISASLPYIFNNNSQIDRIEACCSKCGQTLNDVRGEFTSYNSRSVSMTAYGVCYDCQLITEIESKFSDDGEALHRAAGGWKRGRWGNKKSTGWGGRIKAFLLGRL